VGFLPFAKGKPGEIILAMDSAKWAGKLGDEVRETFKPVVDGLPRGEALFSVRYIDPRKINSILKQVKNIIFVSTLDSNSKGSRIINNYFTKDSRAQIKDNNKLFVFTDQDVFARGQEVMYLFGQTDQQLMEHIVTNRTQLQSHFNSIEDKRLKKRLYKANEVKGINNMLLSEHDCGMRIPSGYQLVENVPGFVWVRRIESHVDKDIFISYQDFNDEEIFQNDNIIKLRESITSKYLFDDPADRSTFVTTQQYMPLIHEEVNFSDKYGVRTKGLWKTNNNAMGGPFLSFTFVDEALNRLYYIEGFIYSPGKSQREFMREISVILSTFKTSSELSTED
jgi:hypothetical protein